MEFKPKSEAEVTEAMLLPKGEYDFEVLFGLDTTSKKNNSMIKLQLGIYDSTGKMRKLYDYLLPEMEAKLRHFCDATGLLPQYQSGTLTADLCVGRSGKCKVDIEPEKGGYGPKNVIKDYCIRKAKPLSAAFPEPGSPGTEPLPGEDDVPF